MHRSKDGGLFQVATTSTRLLLTNSSKPDDRRDRYSQLTSSINSVRVLLLIATNLTDLRADEGVGVS